MKWRRRHWPRIVLTLVPLVLALAHAGGWMRLPVVDALDAFIYDARLRAFQPELADPRIVIVDIDDASLQQYGQWPWRRDRLEQFTRELTERQRVAVLGFDIMFVEDERNSGQAVLQALRQGPWSSQPALAARLAAAVDHDRLFADALRGQPAVLGFYFSNAGLSGGQGALPPAVLPEGLLPAAADHLPRWNHYGASLSQLAEVAPAGFLNVVLDDPQGELRIRDGMAHVVLTDAGPPRPAFAYRAYWLILMGVVCWLIGRRIPLRTLDFACPAPVHRQDYHKFFGAPVLFDQPVTRLVFSSSYLSLPIIRSDVALESFLREAPANILIRYRYDNDLSARVRAQLNALPFTDWPSFEGLAKGLGMSGPTLRRRLRGEGQNFGTIKDELRFVIAERLLRENKLSVAEVAAELGYSEPSAFYRAFHKWMGQSPGRFRTVQQEE